MAATITKGGTLPDTGVTKNEVYALVDSATITGISSTEITGSLAFTRTDTNTNIFSITGDSLTTGGLVYLYSNSASTGGRYLLRVINDNALATGTIPLAITQDANGYGLYITGNGANTTGIHLLQVIGDSIVSGGLAVFSSNSADTTARNLVSIVNDNTLATGAVGLKIQQDAAYYGEYITSSNAAAIYIVSSATTSTTAGVTVVADSLTSGGGLGYFSSNSADTTARNLVSIVNDNTAATGATCLKIQQDAAYIGLDIASSNSAGINITSTATTSTTAGLAITGDYLTSGGGLGYFYSNSTDVSARNLVIIYNDNPAAIGAQCLYLNQDADNTTSIQVMTIDQGGVTAGCSFIDFVGTAEAGVTKPISTHTTIGAYAGSIQVEINGTKQWIPYYGNPSS